MLALKVTIAPPVGAGEVRVSVPVTVAPAGTDDWLRVNEERLAAGAGLPKGVTTIEACGAR